MKTKRRVEFVRVFRVKRNELGSSRVQALSQAIPGQHEHDLAVDYAEQMLGEMPETEAGIRSRLL